LSVVRGKIPCPFTYWGGAYLVKSTRFAPPGLLEAMILPFDQALRTVEEKLSGAVPNTSTETLPLTETLGRILAEDVFADRDYPPFHRSARDGFAVRSSDFTSLPVTLTCVGEIRAGGYFRSSIGQGQCISIMTGAPLPEGADAVVMVEHAQVEDSQVIFQRPIRAFENVIHKASEAAQGDRVLSRGQRLGAGEIGLLAAIGKVSVKVFRKPSVAVLATGDELVGMNQRPEWFQIRNSNSSLLAAQITQAGGIAQILETAPDEVTALRRLIKQGLAADLLLLSGGVSAGKYDLVEQVLAELGAEFYFQKVAIRPGMPVVFGRVAEKFFFGLPGNPVSTYVTFRVFVWPTIRALSGAPFAKPLFLRARLASSVSRKPELTTFVPAWVDSKEGVPTVDPVKWQGSGDLVGLAAANSFLVVHPERARLEAGEWADVMLVDH